MNGPKFAGYHGCGILLIACGWIIILSMCCCHGAFLLEEATFNASLRGPATTGRHRSADEEIMEPTVVKRSVFNNNTNNSTTSSNITIVRTCRIPKLVGDWQSLKCYRFPIAEAQGAMIDGKNLFIVAGFLSRFKRVTRKTFSLDTSRPRAIWRRRDNHPREGGTTHAGFVVVNNIFYMCGGYLGGHPGQHTDGCYSFDISKPRRSQWTSFASLPDDGRAGGGLFYDSTANALFFAAGAKRLDGITIDYNNTWMYSLDDGNPNASGWISKAPSPFVGNHVGFVTAYDATGKERHYIVGGQTGEDEANGNRVENYEYDVGNNVWIPRQSMLIPRGHAASSTRSVGCGYIVAAGTSNGERMISDVSYYDIPTDTWTSIGSLPKAIKTPVCDFATNSEGNTNLYCETGYDQAWFSHKIQVLV